ncbi:MAG: beta-galactosidase trimerization domain-containing protein [Cyclobacteriaceae bacterium]
MNNLKIYTLIGAMFLGSLCVSPTVFGQGDEFYHDLYDSMHDSPMQQKLRKIAPMPYGVVFLAWAGMTEDDMRKHFRMMKELGFTNLKQCMGTPEWPRKEILSVALEEGIIPFWYGEGGWEDITPELLKKLKLPKKMSIQEVREHPKMLAYQKTVLEKHLSTWKDPLPGVENFKHYKHEPDAYLRHDDVPLFKQWIKNKYESIDELANAWNQYEVGISGQPYKSWQDFEKDPLVEYDPNQQYVIVPRNGREYGKVKDILRFKADMYLENVKFYKQNVYPEQPTRAGGEMGLFLPFASRATDMEGIADLMAERGSFYPSIHLAWHFEEADHEVARCIYMQSSIATDWFKGGWAATWESTGGPQQLSGGKGWNVMSQFKTAGYTTNEGTMTQLLLSYLAGGFKGVGLWSWNYRNAGWESGEYALLNRQLEPSPRAIRAGKIAKAADKYRDEIWAAHKEPYVGVFVNWDNEAIWSAVAGPGRTHFKHYPVKSRIGISRALINANVPWEHVTPDDLKKGLGKRYKVIYMPAQSAINADLWPILDEYVQNGGRLVLDAPGGWWDEQGRVLKTGKGTAFEKVFGASIADMQYSNNVPKKIGEHTLDGFVFDLTPTTAVVKETFKLGKPLVTENKYGKGTAVLLAADASYAMQKPGNDFMEKWALKHALGPLESPYACDDAIVYRLAAPDADHYFFINDDVPKRVKLDYKEYKYSKVTDPISGEELSLDGDIDLEAYSGRWLRFEK